MAEEYEGRCLGLLNAESPPDVPDAVLEEAAVLEGMRGDPSFHCS